MIQNVLKFNNNFILNGLRSIFEWGRSHSFAAVNLQKFLEINTKCIENAK